MLHISLFNSLQIQHAADDTFASNDGVQLTPPAQALLIYLIMRQEEHSRAELAQLIWTGAADAVARHQLDLALDELRQQVGDLLLITPHHVAFRSDAPHQVDLLDFARKSESVAPGALWPETDALEEAAALYTGDLLQTFPLTALAEATGFTAWLQDERQRWRSRMVLVLEALADEAMSSNECEAAIVRMEHLLRLDPANENAHRRIMLACARLDQMERALAQYERCAEVLSAIERTPDASTRALYTRIDLAGLDPQYELPGEGTPFVGRGPEQAQLHNMLLGREASLVTLTGLGGIGKTRLALEVARQIIADPHRLFLSGVVFVPLAGVPATEDLPQALLAALELTPAGNIDPLDHLLDHLRPREMLLILDNVEHLDSAPLIGQILDECGHITIVATSRVPLLLGDEWRFDLTGLACTPPAPAAFEPCASTQLFTGAAQRANPSFELTKDNRLDVYRLCELVAGIPLAIELAAAWSTTLTIAGIVERIQTNLDTLTDQQHAMPPRQRSMRVVLDYTWSQLVPEQQAVLRALSVCRAPFSETAAERITQQSAMALPPLVEQNLLQMEFNMSGMRYEMHELLRQYGEEKLTADPAEDAVRERHGLFYLELVANEEDALFGETPQEAVARLRQQIDNVRAAWQWAIAHVERTEIRQQLSQSSMAVATFYEAVGWIEEGQRAFRTAVDACDTLLNRYAESESTASTDENENKNEDIDY